MADAWVVETIGLRKRYADVEALRGLDIRVARGSIVGFLGRNGAGKTTALKILSGMVHATGGEARVFGLPANVEASSVAIRRRSGFVSDEKDLYDAMDVGALIRFTASFFSTWRTDLEQRYLREFELPIGRPVTALSRGMRTKLALLLALCRGAELLMLDEPTSGLDPALTEQVLQALVRHVATEEMTVVFSSHQIAEVEQIADHVVIIDRGRSVIDGALDDLRQDVCRVRVVFEGDAPEPMFTAPGVERVSRDGRVLTVLTRTGAQRVIEQARRLQPVSIDTLPVTLKDIFLECVAAEER